MSLPSLSTLPITRFLVLIFAGAGVYYSYEKIFTYVLYPGSIASDTYPAVRIFRNLIKIDQNRDTMDRLIRKIENLNRPEIVTVRVDFFQILVDYMTAQKCPHCPLTVIEKTAIDHFNSGQVGRDIRAQLKTAASAGLTQINPANVVSIPNPIPSQQVVVSIPVEDSNAKSLKIIKDLLKD